jgi:hypothetical protein
MDNKSKLFVTVLIFTPACMTNTYSPKLGFAHTVPVTSNITLNRDSKADAREFAPR